MVEALYLGGKRYDTLIGYTGFVGSTLDNAFAFRHRINSKNSATLAGLEADGVICAGVYAEKWRANADPAADLAHVTSVFDSLRGIRTKRLLLISTIDVNNAPNGADESTMTDPDQSSAYGLHRLMLESWVRDHFAEVNIVRLPGLFGHGLKKNLIFDLIRNNQIEKIHPEGQLQWFNMARFAGILDAAVAHDVGLLNIVTEPIRTGDIRDRIAPGASIGADAAVPPPFYDARTRYAFLTGRSDGYHYGATETLVEIGEFARQTRTAA